MHQGIPLLMVDMDTTSPLATGPDQQGGDGAEPLGHELHSVLKGHSSHPPKPDPRPLAGYAVLLVTYGALTAATVVALRRRRSRLKLPNGGELALYALATEHISRLITKDSISAVLRSPFTEFEEAAGEGEVNEKVVGDGWRHAVGELVTCPFCVAQWVATALVAGSVGAPALTTGIVSVSAIARVSDYLQLSYGIVREKEGS